MRVLIAGGTGVIGQQLIPVLGEAGHQVTVLARSSTRAKVATDAGAEFVEADALHRSSLIGAVERARPDVVVNLLTAIPQGLNPKKMASEFEATNRLRIEGTRNLVQAARDAGGARVISESIAFAYAPGQKRVVGEDASLWIDGPRQFRTVVAALQELERQTVESGGIVLRFGHLYGPGTSLDRDGSMTGQVRKGKIPIVGAGDGVFSFLHTYDAAQGVLAAISHEGPGIFNVVDDEPSDVQTWLPELAKVVGAPEPKHVPVVLARLFVGAWGVAYMTKLCGASNTHARGVLGWKPRYTRWREGFRQELALSG